MRKKIIALIGLLLICSSVASVQAADVLQLEDGENVAIKDVYVRARLTNDSDKPMELYIWAVFNEKAESYGNDLHINISIDGDVIGDDLPIGICQVGQLADGETADDLAVAGAFVYEDYGIYSNGSHTVRVEFINIANDARSQDNAKEVSFTAPSEWYAFITNGFIWSTLYTIDGALGDASEATGMSFLDDIPVLPLVVGIILLIIIILIWRWYKNKKSKNVRRGMPPVKKKPSYYYTKAYHPPQYPQQPGYNQYRPPEQPPYY